MKINLSVILFCLLLTAGYAAADDKGIEVRPAGKQLFEIRPKEMVTTAFRVTNTTADIQELVSEVKLPEDWLLITEDFPFHLQPNKSRTKPLSLFVPETTAAGSYKVTYIVRARKYPSIRDFYTLDIVVAPHSRLEVTPQNAPKCVTAGEDYQVSFSITNKSNVENTIGININSSENVPFVIDTDTFSLAPGRSKTITVTVCPEIKITRVLKHRLQLTARITGTNKPNIQAKAAYSTEIIPQADRIKNRFDAVVLKTITDKPRMENRYHPPAVHTETAREETTDTQEQKPLHFATVTPKHTETVPVPAETQQSPEQHNQDRPQPVLTAAQTPTDLASVEEELSKKKRMLMTAAA